MKPEKIIGKSTVSLVMPCLNEAETLAACIKEAQSGLRLAKTSGEIIVVDNGSSDTSQQIAINCGAKLVKTNDRGYGVALRAGIEMATGKFIIIADADKSYDWTEVGPFIANLRKGHHLVIGTRIKGRILPGAMPWLHRWIGTPILTVIGNLLFGTKLSDYQSGMRGFQRNHINQLNLRTRGMEFASEMIIKAAAKGLIISEIPITYRPDGRSRPSHLRTWSDGWRHFRYIIQFYIVGDT